MCSSPIQLTHDVHGDVELLAACTEGDAAQRAHVREVTAPGDGDVAVAEEQIVGGIGVDPAGGFAAEDGDQACEASAPVRRILPGGAMVSR